MLQEAYHGQHVAALAPVLGVDRVDGAADEDPQRPLQVVGPQEISLFLEEALLLVKGQQVAQQQRLGLLLTGLLFEVEDAKVLAVAVAVEIAVGVVEGNGLAVLSRQLIVARRGQGLAEGGAVLEGEAGLAQGVAVFAPDRAARAFVPFVHEDQVVALEGLHRHAQAAAALFLHQLGDLDDPHRVSGGQAQSALVQIEAPGGDAGSRQLGQVLLAQPLVGRD